MSDLSRLRVLVVHEWLLEWAGAERTLGEIMAVVPHADLVVGAVSPAMRASNPIATRARETWLGALPGARTSGSHRWLIPFQYPAFSGINTAGYDLVISSAHGFSKAVAVHGNTKHYCYCYSPPRYLWDMADSYQAREGGATALALRMSMPVLRSLDRRSALGVHRFAGISHHVARRIKLAYGRDADVVYPPVSAKPTRPAAREDFLFVMGRLVSYKRVDLAIQAAERLGIPIKVAGTGPDRARLERFAGPHTTFLGGITEEAAGDLMERCRAFVFCAEEDFGIAPLEANAHGAPVAGLARGALVETMVDGVTAEFFREPTVDAVVAALQSALKRKWDGGACRTNAARFAPEHFRAALAERLLALVSFRA